MEEFGPPKRPTASKFSKKWPFRKNEVDRSREQAILDEEWTAFLNNDPALVITTLETAFQDNFAPAAAVGCEGNVAYVVIRWPGVASLVGDRKLARTPSGKATHHQRGQNERNSLYLQALASTVLATTKEALAVAPGLEEVSTVVVSGDADFERGGTWLSAIAATSIRRSDLEGVRWDNVNPDVLLRSLRRTRILINKNTGEIFRLDVEHDPAFAEGLSQVAEAMGWKVRAPIPGGRVNAWFRRTAFEWLVSDT